VYDLRSFMDGHYDDNFYFNNPVDYVANLSDPWYLDELARDDIRLVTGCGPFEDSRSWSWLSAILPHLEQNNLYEKGDIPNRPLATSTILDAVLQFRTYLEAREGR
jgi:esterase/lipase superfamily enzyme